MVPTEPFNDENIYTHIQVHKHTHTHTLSLIPPWEDQCEWHRMTRMRGPDCAVMFNLINTHTHTHTHTRSIEDSGINPTAFSCFAPTSESGQPIPAPVIVAVRTAVANSRRCAVSQRPHGQLELFCVMVCFGTRGEKDLLGHRRVHTDIQ